MTEKELERLEEFACEILAFSDYPNMYRVDVALEEIYQKFQKALSNRNRELYDEVIKEAENEIFDPHYNLDTLLKYALIEFRYWSGKNTSIANVILDYLGILGEFYKIYQRINGTIKTQSLDLTKQHIDSLIKKLYSPELQNTCDTLGDKLYGIYYGEILLQQELCNPDNEKNHFEGCEDRDDSTWESETYQSNNSPLLLLQKRESLVLDVLYNARPEIITLEKIAETAKRAKMTVFSALRSLCERDLVTQNERKNYIITQAGIEFFEKHFC